MNKNMANEGLGCSAPACNEETLGEMMWARVDLVCGCGCVCKESTQSVMFEPLCQPFQRAGQIAFGMGGRKARPPLTPVLQIA